MNSLAIGPDGTDGLAVCAVLGLNGEGAAPPFRGAFYEQPGGAGEVLEDHLDAQLEGTPAQISAGLAAVESLFERAREKAARGTGTQIYLLARQEAGGALWRSPLLDGWVEKRKGEIGRGSLVVRLRLARRNYWEGAEQLTPLSNLHGSRQLNLLKVDNHTDGEHCNYAEIDPADLPGELPAPYRLQMTGDHGGIPGWVGPIYLSVNNNLVPGDPITHWLEGENAYNGTVTASADCSNGAYKALSWTGTAEEELIWWQVDRAVLGLGGGRYYRPLMRFFPAPTAGDVWLKLRIQSGTMPVWEGPWQRLSPGVELQELSSLRLPPYLAGETHLLPLYLMVLGRRSAGGSTSLGVDYLHLAPLDGWRKLVTRGWGMGADAVLEDDGFQDCVYLNESGEYKTDYLVYGEPPRLYPGRLQRLYFLMMNRDTLAAEPGRGFRLRLYYRPRRRMI